MLDLIFVASTALFFAAGILYVYGCERLRKGWGCECKWRHLVGDLRASAWVFAVCVAEGGGVL